MGLSIIRGRGERTGSHDLKKTRLTLSPRAPGIEWELVMVAHDRRYVNCILGNDQSLACYGQGICFLRVQTAPYPKVHFGHHKSLHSL